MTAADRADIAILGAGVAGAALAIRLAALGARVILVDARPADPTQWPDRPGERLSAATRFALDDLGIAVEQFALAEAGMRLHWAGPMPSDMPAASAPALLCARTGLDAALIARAQALGVRFCAGHRFCGLLGQPGRWQMQLQAAMPQEIEAGLLVDASGRRAALAQALGQAQIRRDDAMVGLVRWWLGGPPQRPVFHLEAIAGGWWYASALPDGRGVAGFVTPRPLLTGRPLAAWQAALDRAPLIRSALPPQPVWGPVASFAAGPGLAAQLVGPGWARLGDAAAQGDPIAGQGVFRALQTAADLAQLITAAPAAQASLRQDYTASLARWHADHLHQRQMVYDDSDRLGPDFHHWLAQPKKESFATAGS